MKNKFFVAILLLLLCLVYWQWFLPGIKVANDLPMPTDSSLENSMNVPFVWLESGSDALGEYSTFFLWGWPMSFIWGFLANAGLSFAILERVLFFIPFLLIGCVGIWKFCGSIKISVEAKFIASFFYLTNTYILLVFDGGQLSIALTYAFFPIAFLAVIGSIEGGLSKKLQAGLAVSILGFLDFRFIYLLFLLCAVFFIYQFFLNFKQKKAWYLGWISSGVVISLIVTGLNAYWLLPLLKAPISSGTYAFFTQSSFLNFLNLGHSILLLAPHWFKNIFGNITALRPEFIFIPILVFLAPILRPKNRIVGFWLLVAIISIFLTKGDADPLSGVYPWLFSHIPGFSLFRDSTKFFFLEALSYSVLLGVTIDEILSRTVRFPKFKIFFLILVSGYLLFLIRPVWGGEMTGTFSHPVFQQEFTELRRFMENDKNTGIILWIPFLPPLGIVNQTHPRTEASRLVQKRPFAIGTIGTYETFNFLREAPFMGEIFDVAGISYIAYPFLDPRRDNMHPDNVKYYYTFLDQLSKEPWLSRVNDSAIPLLKTRVHQDKFFMTPDVWWVIGSDNIYNSATKSADLKLSKNAMIFAEESPGLGRKLGQLPEANIVLNGKTSLDLAASFIDPENLIFPAKNLSFNPDQSGWWKRGVADLILWRSFLQDKYKIDNQDFDLGGGWAVGEGERQFTIYNLQFTKGKVLLARVMESSKSGELKFYQNNQEIGSISTKINGDANVRWFEIGRLDSGDELTIASKGDINVVNTLAVLNKSDWDKSQDEAKKLQGRIVNFTEKNTQNDDKPIVSYKQINPTKYKVTISNLIKPGFLVFSQNFDTFWKLDGQPPLPVYSLLNGFKVERDGEYALEFVPQKYIYPGLVISGIMTICLSLFFLRRRLSSHK